MEPLVVATLVAAFLIMIVVAALAFIILVRHDDW